MANDLDPIELSRRLIRCPSVTPRDAGALDVLQEFLSRHGFVCHRLPFSGDGEERVDNLYARLGGARPNFCFAGHTDVVPVGDESTWTVPPFEAAIKEDRLYGRGAADMKAAVASFAVAAVKFFKSRPPRFKGSISLLITGDEEGVAVNGTAKVLKWMAANGEAIDACLVGEPTNPSALGDMIKIGRRGSLTGTVTVHGTQGHSAYPQLADNPIPRLMKMLAAIADAPLDQGNEHFQPTLAVVTTIDVGNPAGNVIPGKAFARFNIRFNNRHTGESLKRLVKERFDAVGGRYDLEIKVSGEAFLTPAGRLSDVVSAAVERVTGRRPELSTTGGTSDARFIKDYCPVAEFGLIGQTMHKVDENVRISDIHALAAIYEAVLEGYFAEPNP
ncbi:MAG: succinyl-diaminopimelate desuccinylase [Rhodospirillales bacterium]|nr:succinyl-diaminopimelate desuccinylase [Rhodospirillales bacterium]